MVPAAAVPPDMVPAAAVPPDVVDGGGLERSDVTYAIVTHGTPRDPFWSVVSNGAQDAARDLGVRVSYQVPNSFNMVAMSRLIDAAVVSRPDGLVVSVPRRRRSRTRHPR